MAHIRRIAFNLMLLAVFAALAFTLGSRLSAEIQFGRAEKLVPEKRWREAEVRFENAIKSDPFDAGYPAGMAAFLSDQARYRDNPAPSLARAKRLYEEAARLNPANPEYPLMAGRIDLRLGRDVAAAFTHFQSAFRNDPNGFNTAYSIGYAGLSAWEYLDEYKKNFVLDRLRCALKIEPRYSRYIYSVLWRKSKDFGMLVEITPPAAVAKTNLYNFMAANNLWQFRKTAGIKPEFRIPEEALAQRKRLSDVTAHVFKEEWSGSSYDGKSKISGGVMYWSGVIFAPVMMQPGRAEISIEAKKILVIKAADVSSPRLFPYMIVRLDKTVIGETFVPNDEWREYKFPADTAGGPKLLSVEFTNDIYDPAKGEDRNLAVGDARISYD